MSEATPNDEAQAEAIVRQLSAHEPDVAAEIAGDTTIVDVEARMDQFDTELGILAEQGLPVPATRLSGDVVVPVSIHLVAGVDDYNEPWPDQSPAPEAWPSEAWSPDVRRLVDAHIRDTIDIDLLVRRLNSGDVEVISHDTARESFIQGARRFLTTRLASARDTGWASALLRPQAGSGSHARPTPTCTFTVDTASSGLTVYWSGAYFIAPYFFDQPTTPAANNLPAGVYVFGVNGGPGGTLRWDTNAVVALPGSSRLYLNF